MPRQQFRTSALAVACVLGLSGCGSGPAATPTPAAPVALDARALAVIAEDHVRAATWGYPVPLLDNAQPTDLRTGLYWAPTPGVAAHTLTVGYEAPSLLSLVELQCTDGRVGPYRCADRDGVRLVAKGGGVVVGALRDGVVVTAESTAEVLADPATAPLPEAVTKLVELVRDPRIAAMTTPEVGAAAASYPRWRDDPFCERAKPAGLRPAPAASGQPAVPTTPQALVALLAERVDAACGYGSGAGSEVTGTVMLGPKSDDDRVSVRLTRDKLNCKGRDECRTIGEVTVSYQFDVPEEYPATVRLTRPITGGYLELKHTSHQADAKKRTFPVPLDTLLALVNDQRFAFEVDPALVTAGEQSSLCWRVEIPTSE